MSVDIFVDLDEVLADWLTPALAQFGCDPAKVYADWAKLDPRPWNVFDVIDMSANKGWARLQLAGEEFWARLPMFPHAKQLWAACLEIDSGAMILTSPSRESSSYAGKVQWLDRHFGKGFAQANAMLGGRKAKIARPGAVLIDDSPKNCAAWEAEGGDAILFPGYGNELYMHRERAFDYIRPQLKAFAQ